MSAIPNLPLDTAGLTTNGLSNGSSSSTFRSDDAPIENLRPLRVIVIGAGYSGIYCGIRIPEKLRNVDLVIYEKNAGVGGAWYENRWVDAAVYQNQNQAINDGVGLTRPLTDIWDAHATCPVSTWWLLLYIT